MESKTLIIGNGPCALQTAHLLADHGLGVIIANRDASLAGPEELVQAVSGHFAVELLSGYRLERLTGQAGRFEAHLVNGSGRQHRVVAGVVVAEESRRVSNAALYGLDSGGQALSVSRFRQQLADEPSRLKDKTVALINGLFAETNAVVAGQAFQAALDLQQVAGAQGYFFSTNLKVAAAGLEKKYRDAKAAGCLFFKFKETRPVITAGRNGAVTIEFDDEVHGEAYSLTPDVVVVDESWLPSDYLTELARLMQLDTDQTGFIQSDNVHRLTVSTNRRGIFAAGPARMVMSAADTLVDAANAAEAVLALHNGAADEHAYRADIDTGQCIACLTCLRLCPYKAVIRGHRMNVAEDACEGCGICAAECPRGAIAMNGSDSEIDRQIGALVAGNQKDGVPAIMLFACSRSAYRAGSEAICLDYTLPEGLTTIVVPCAGAVSVQHLLAALRGGADGVLVMTCHTGNCHSENGNIHARRRVELLAEQLQGVGISPARLQIHTLAANMAREFADITLGFEKTLIETNRK